jgi:hypothetical protein
MRHTFKLLIAAFALLALAACGDPSKGEIIKKAETAETKADLEKALGAPTEVDKVGPIEKWVYKASDGEVVFVIAGDLVTLQATSDKDDD